MQRQQKRIEQHISRIFIGTHLSPRSEECGLEKSAFEKCATTCNDVVNGKMNACYLPACEKIRMKFPV